MDYIAHIRETDNKIQTVNEHCAGVAALCEKYTKKLKLSSLAYLQGIFHDVGKMTADFNKYIQGESSFRRGEIDHSFAGAKYLCEISDRFNDKNKTKACRFIARTIISHHGLHDWLDEEGNDVFSKRISKNDRYDEIEKGIEKLSNSMELESLIEKSTYEYMTVRKRIYDISFGSRKKFSFYLGMFERFMQSVLIDADRIDTADFMSGCKTEKEFDVSALWENMYNKMQVKLDGFKDRTDRISIQRNDISRRCAEFAKHKVGICRLTVPTGGGKTLSSLRFAIDYCKNYNMEKIIYVAPFMSILEQNSDEIRSVAGEDNVLEHHSNILQETDNKEELHEYELRTEKWDSPVIATTMVQFLNTLFSDKNSCLRRMHRLSHAVIIIDEVQSIPLKCVNLFNLAMNFLTKICGSSVVLCSATQPAFENAEYSLMLDEEYNMTGDYAEDFEIFKRTELISKITAEGYTYGDAADFCYQRYLESKNLLVVVNTKESAESVFKLIKDKNEEASDSEKAEIIHLSTYMCPQHRRDRIDQLRKLLNENNRIICVTTKLIEAGVDISFGCVVRSLAGMDNAAQAAGRCNRNGERKEVCPVYLINIKDENINKMNELKTAQDISRQIADSDEFSDLLSCETMSVYFEKLYKTQKNILSYNIKNSETLVDLLSLNEKRFARFKKTNLQYCCQAFKTAGEKFDVIDDKTYDFLVPYNDKAKNIISRLDSDIPLKETIDLLRTAQKYTISVYPKIKEKLYEAGAIEKHECGALSIKKEFYDDFLGVVTKGRKPEVLTY